MAFGYELHKLPCPTRWVLTLERESIATWTMLQKPALPALLRHAIKTPTLPERAPEPEPDPIDDFDGSIARYEEWKRWSQSDQYDEFQDTDWN